VSTYIPSTVIINRRIAAGEVPDSMKNKQVYALDLAAMIGE